MKWDLHCSLPFKTYYFQLYKGCWDGEGSAAKIKEEEGWLFFFFLAASLSVRLFSKAWKSLSNVSPTYITNQNESLNNLKGFKSIIYTKQNVFHARILVWSCYIFYQLIIINRSWLWRLERRNFAVSYSFQHWSDSLKYSSIRYSIFLGLLVSNTYKVRYSQKSSDLQNIDLSCALIGWWTSF